MTSASILLVEDETLIRMMTAEIVEELGHRVVAQASKVSEGVILAKTAEFDLAMLDINIGGYSDSPSRCDHRSAWHSNAILHGLC